MAPFFFKELRRRSRASFRTEHSTDASSDAGGSNGTTPTNGSLTPPSLSSTSDPSLLLVDRKDSCTPPPPPTARPHSTAGPNVNNRNSIYGTGSMGYLSTNGKPALPVSQYAPRITNVNENAWVYQKVILLHGTIGDPAQQCIDGTLTVSRLDDTFPPTTWPVCSSHFKALVYLQPGPNRLRFEFTNPKLASSRTSLPVHASYLTMHMLPPTSTPPLQLAILVASDSTETFDAMPARQEREGNDLDLAVRKFRMAAYLWQAFTAEQTARNRLGRRTFRFDEEWTLGSANYRDADLGTMRSEARVHIVRMDKTVEEIRSLGQAEQQQCSGAGGEKGALFDVAAEAVRNYFRPLPSQKQYVSALILDTHWDPEAKVLKGHVAAGGPVGKDLQLAIFGSHCLQSYPASFEEVAPAFTDCTPTDARYVANEGNQAGSSWEAASTGIGAHLHQVGHLFGCTHREGGVMIPEGVGLNRAFVAREAYCTRTRSKGGLVRAEDECAWHRLDCLRFRSHPCFRLPNDAVMHPDASVQVCPVEGGNVVVMAATGVSFVEIYAEGGEDVCRGWIEYPVENGSPQRQVVLCEQDLRARIPSAKRGARLRLSIRSYGGGSAEVADFKKLCSKESSFKMGSGHTAYRAQMVGSGGARADGSAEAFEVVFIGGMKNENHVVSRIVVHHGEALAGLEFVYEDGSTELFGKRGEETAADTFELEIRRGEYLTGFSVKVGESIEAVQFVTSVGRKSAMFGNSRNGSLHTLIPPRGHNVVGVRGTCSQWLDGFALVTSH